MFLLPIILLVTSAINRGSRDRQSGSQSPRGTPISSAGPVGPYSYNWPYQPTKASSSASLVLHAGGGGQDSDTGSYYSPSPWSMIDENDSMDEQPMAGSVTSLAAERFKENMATRKAINHPPPIGMNRSRSLDDIRKQVPYIYTHTCTYVQYRLFAGSDAECGR